MINSELCKYSNKNNRQKLTLAAIYDYNKQ